MRKIVAGLFITVDGVVEAPEQWQFPYYNEEMAETVSAQMAAADTMLLGRKTYEVFAAFWPNQSGDVPFAEYINNTPKLVASRTLKSVAWQNSTLITGDVSDHLRRLKSEPGGDISITGSGTLVGSLLRANVLDELRLLVHPVLVGSGQRLFEESAGRVPLELVESRTFSTGVLYLTYRPAAA